MCWRPGSALDLAGAAYSAPQISLAGLRRGREGMGEEGIGETDRKVVKEGTGEGKRRGEEGKGGEKRGCCPCLQGQQPLTQMLTRDLFAVANVVVSRFVCLCIVF